MQQQHPHSHPRWSSGDQTGSALPSSHSSIVRPSAGSPTIVDDDIAFLSKDASSVVLGRASLSALHQRQQSLRTASPLGGAAGLASSAPMTKPMQPPRHAASWGAADASADPSGRLPSGGGARLSKGGASSSRKDGSGAGGGRLMRVSLRGVEGGSGSGRSLGRSSLRSMMADGESSNRSAGRMMSVRVHAHRSRAYVFPDRRYWYLIAFEFESLINVILSAGAHV